MLYLDVFLLVLEELLVETFDCLGIGPPTKVVLYEGDPADLRRESDPSKVRLLLWRP